MQESGYKLAPSGETHGIQNFHEVLQTQTAGLECLTKDLGLQVPKLLTSPRTRGIKVFRITRIMEHEGLSPIHYV